VGIEKRIGWHTFRHSYASWLLIKLLGTDSKVMQELMRHASLLTTLNTYTEAMTTAKCAAQNGVMSLLFGHDDEDQLTWLHIART
jgi:site-specific recombinase XerD